MREGMMTLMLPMLWSKVSDLTERRCVFVAAIVTLFSVTSKEQPVKTGLASSVLQAKTVFLIRSRRILSLIAKSRLPSSGWMVGNSAAFMESRVNLAMADSMWTIFSSAVQASLTFSPGSLRTTSWK